MPPKHDPRHHIPPHLSGWDEPPPPNHHRDRWQPPFPTDYDLELLKELLEDDDDAKSVYRLFESCPPEVAATGILTLRVSNRISQLEQKLASLEEKIASMEVSHESSRTNI